LTRALGAARELIYIDGAAFAPTGYGTPPTPIDLVTTIRDRLQAVPALRVILCLSKELDYGPGYEVVAAREYQQRLDAVAKLQQADPSRVAVFHPIGFPGRPLRLMTNITIVDDVWAMVGSSAFRRRGLTFDGGLDLVLADTNLRDGRGVAIADLRRRRQPRLQRPPPPAATVGTFRCQSVIRLADAHPRSPVQGVARPGWDRANRAAWDGTFPVRRHHDVSQRRPRHPTGASSAPSPGSLAPRQPGPPPPAPTGGTV
jgi:hypothetical protein